MQPLPKKASLGDQLKQLWTAATDAVKGGKKLYHCTSEQNCQSIERNGFRPGSHGIVGGGIYFAETPADAVRKAHNSGVVLKCRVKLGKVLDVGRSGNSSLNLNAIKEQGCDSVRVPRSGTEYCVYEPSRIRVVDRCKGHPLVRLQRPCSQCYPVLGQLQQTKQTKGSGWSGDCFLCMGTGIADYYEDAAKFSSSAHRH